MSTIKGPFYPGKAVTADFLNESQYFGPSNPGVRFTANPVHFWEYPLLDTSQMDMGDLGSKFILKSGNVTITGTKTFTTLPAIPTATPGTQSDAAASTAFVINEIENAVINGDFVDVGSTQTITGAKVFQNIEVPATPAFLTSPVPLGFLASNYVPLGGNTNITGIKAFASPPQVPAPVAGPDATPKGYVDGLFSTLASDITGAEAAIAALQAIAAGLTVTSGTYPGGAGNIDFYVVRFPGNAKLLFGGGAGTGAQEEVILFPTLAQGFVGFATAPIVLVTGLGTHREMFSPLVSTVSTTGFYKNNSTYGNGGGCALNYLAFGV